MTIVSHDGAKDEGALGIQPPLIGGPPELIWTSAPCQSHAVLSAGAVTQVPGLARRCAAFVGNFLTMLLALFVLDWLFFLLG